VIDWSNAKEVFLHDSITKLTQIYLKMQEKEIYNQIIQEFNQLFDIV
jgi:hypothetical protein